MTITVRKALDQSERLRRKKRGGGRVRGESALGAGGSDEREAGLEQVVGTGAVRPSSPRWSPTSAAACSKSLGDETLRRIALLRMEGYSDPEIAARLGCGLRTVGRKLELIRKIWQREVTP